MHEINFARKTCSLVHVFRPLLYSHGFCWSVESSFHTHGLPYLAAMCPFAVHSTGVAKMAQSFQYLLALIQLLQILISSFTSPRSNVQAGYLG